MVQSLATIGTVGASPMKQLIPPAVSRVLCFLIPVVVFGSIINDLATMPVQGSFTYSVDHSKVK